MDDCQDEINSSIVFERQHLQCHRFVRPATNYRLMILVNSNYYVTRFVEFVRRREETGMTIVAEA